MDVDRCVMCGAPVPEGTQVCVNCMQKIELQGAGAETETQELRDIAKVLSITAGTDASIKESMEAILRIADRLERKKKCRGTNRK